jgi:hypothetical protein
MALLSKVGAFASPGSTGTLATTGVGFQPKVLLICLYKNQNTANGGPMSQVHGQSIGFAVGTAAGDQIVAAWNVRGDGNYTTSARWKQDACLSGSSSGANIVYIDAALSSFDADGFTLNFTSASTDFMVWYLALGGSDLTGATLVTLDTPTAIGTQAVTGAGFAPDALLFLSSGFNSTSTDNYQSNGGAPQLGICSAASGYAIANWGSTFAGTTGTYGRDDRCLAMQKDFGPNLWGDAILDSLDADGFTLDWQTVSTEVTRVWALCLAGTNIAVGSTAQRTSTGTTAVTGLGFTPMRCFCAATARSPSASLASANASLNLGAAASTTERQAATYGRAHNGGGTPGSAQTLSTGKIALHHTPSTSSPTGSSLSADADLSAFGSDGFTLDWTTVDATARTWGWIAFGGASAPATAPLFYRRR